MYIQAIKTIKFKNFVYKKLWLKFLKSKYINTAGPKRESSKNLSCSYFIDAK